MKTRKLSLIVNSLVFLALVVTSLASPVHAEPQATFTVTTNIDMVDFLPGDGVCETADGNGMCTLRAAIMEANALIGEDIIDLPNATYLLTIPGADEDLGATGDLDITDSLRIRGQYWGYTIIDAEGLADRVFDISGTGVSVYISRVWITNGSVTGEGGAIRAKAELTLQDFYLDNSQASGDGGGIYILKPLTLINGTVDDCSSGLQGGAIYTISNLNTNGTIIHGNTADGEGGAIFANSTAQVHLIDTKFSENEAIVDGGSIYSAGELEMEGGYIDTSEAGNAGGGIYAAADSQTTLTDVDFDDNHAGTGGGIWIGASVNLTGNDLILSSNSADAVGGAINNANGSVQLYRSVLSNNSAASGGAIISIGVEQGDVSIQDSTVISNTATLNGGGIYNSGVITLTGVTLSENHAETGGGVYNFGSLLIENSTLSKNSAEDNGGGIYDAGGIYIAIYNATITTNLAGSDIMSPGGEGGGVYAADDYVYFRNTILSGNHHRVLVNFVDDDCVGTLQSGDYNLIGTLNDCGLAPAAHDLVGENPLLGELADNGGATYTYALLEGSPAVDGGNPEGCLGIDDATLYFDQRGVKRPLDGDKDGTARCDIGAYEVSHSVTMYLPLLVK